MFVFVFIRFYLMFHLVPLCVHHSVYGGRLDSSAVVYANEVFYNGMNIMKAKRDIVSAKSFFCDCI